MIWPAFLAITPLSTLLWTLFIGFVVPALGRSLLALGIGFVTFTGFQLAFNQLESYIQGTMVGIDPAILDMMALTRIDDAVSLVMSAMSIKLTLKLAGRTAERVFRLKV